MKLTAEKNELFRNVRQGENNKIGSCREGKTTLMEPVT